MRRGRSERPRIEQYAKLLVETCVDVQPGWQVLVWRQPLARPLLEEVTAADRAPRRLRAAAPRPRRRSGDHRAWVAEAPDELLAAPPPIDAYMLENGDALIAIQAPENTRELPAFPPERLAAIQAGLPAAHRARALRRPHVGRLPVPDAGAGAGGGHDARRLRGLPLRRLPARLGRRARADERYAERFDAADEVRIVGDGHRPPPRSPAGPAMVDAGGATCPAASSSATGRGLGRGRRSRSPSSRRSRRAARCAASGCASRAGKVVDASADGEGGVPARELDTDEGARRLGELGIGCNPGITRHMRNTLFDEKIDGTVHLALGNGFPTSAARTSASSTGTSSRTCARRRPHRAGRQKSCRKAAAG